MSDIFLSYASVDRPIARRLADALEACGWTVWWDHRNLRGGQDFESVIEEAIASARVVIVVWSQSSIKSHWVKAEAAEALTHEKLVPLRIDTAVLPLRFRNYHTVDLSNWLEKAEADSFESLHKTLCYHLGASKSPTSSKPSTTAFEGLWSKPTATAFEAAAVKRASDLGDYATVLQLARPAADHGDASAQSWVGWLYQNGFGVAQDYAEAMRWYRKAADQGHADAHNNIGWLYENGFGVAQDYGEAMRWYRKAADQGDAWAQNNIGVLYKNGQGVAQDYAEAMRWYRKAADQGDASALSNIGVLYKNGQGVAQDYAEAMRWYRKAADQGDADAHNNIGWLYENGFGVAQDYGEAMRWYRKAADQGLASAQSNIDRLSANVLIGQLAQWLQGLGKKS